MTYVVELVALSNGSRAVRQQRAYEVRVLSMQMIASAAFTVLALISAVAHGRSALGA